LVEVRYLATINFGDFMPTNARESLACAASRWGCQFLEITRPWVDVSHLDIFRHKLAICDFPAWRFGDEVTLIDGDILIRDDAPYPFTSSETFAGVHGLQDDTAVEYATRYADGLRMPFDADSYVNGGLLRFFPHRHADVFETALRYIGGVSPIEPMLEQTAMNAAALQLGDGFEVQRDAKYNTVGERAWEQLDMAAGSFQYIKHLARWRDKGHDFDERKRAIQGVKWRTKP
jgi:hypothetical protein